MSTACSFSSETLRSLPTQNNLEKEELSKTNCKALWFIFSPAACRSKHFVLGWVTHDQGQDITTKPTNATCTLLWHTSTTLTCPSHHQDHQSVSQLGPISWHTSQPSQRNTKRISHAKQTWPFKWNKQAKINKQIYTKLAVKKVLKPHT